tara:strand:+ start:23 stop:208 length:186 start_codon:yes stop_codon:yes gene_type:complete
MLIQTYLPVQRGDVRVSNFTVINAVLFVAENGCKWPRFGKWRTGLHPNASLGRRRRSWPSV